MARAVFTIVTPVRDQEALASLDKVLERIGSSLPDNPHLPLKPDTFPELHFASFVVFDRARGRPTLAFENCTDTSIDAYLRKLADRAGIDDIYRHCDGYPAAPDPPSRFAYLRSHVRRPQLFHLGAPYRTAQSIRKDRDVRAQIDRELRSAAPGLLSRQLVRPPAGIREYWWWEVLKPWVAFLLAATILSVAVWILGRVNWDWRNHFWWSLLRAFGAAVALVVSLLGAHGLWRTTPSEVRTRAQPWLLALLAAAAAAVVIWKSELAVAGWFQGSRLTRVAVIAAGLALLLVAGIRRAVLLRRSDRIATVRVAAGGETVVPLWQTLQRISGNYRLERPGLLRRLGNWWLWPVPVAVFGFLANKFGPSHPVPMAVGLVAAFGLEAAWFATLTGWPGRPAPGGRRTNGFKFVTLSTLLATLFVVGLMKLGVSDWRLGVLVALGLLLLWGAQVPWLDPDAEPDPATGNPPATADALAAAAVLRDVIDQEDRDTLNHMFVVAEVAARWRRMVLWLFLRVQNFAFYRALLADLWGGKLFGLPTVHCAQWVLIGGGRFLFVSNYDHSWSMYLDDFGKQIGNGIQMIWGQCTNNPGTADLGQFKRYVRSSMVPYAVWYRAYEGLTVRQIWNNERLRAALAPDAEEEAIVEAVRRLGASPKILPEIVHAAQ